MSVPWSRAEQEGHSSWSLEELEEHQRKKEMHGISGTDNPAMRALEGRAEVERMEEDGVDEFGGGKNMDADMMDAVNR
jgi:DNA excision repair protein ERCC-2